MHREVSDVGTEQPQSARGASPAVAATTTDYRLQAAIAAERPDLHAALATNPALYTELREWLAQVSWHPAPHVSGATEQGAGPTASVVPEESPVTGHPGADAAPGAEEPAAVAAESAPVSAEPVVSSPQSQEKDEPVIDYSAATTVLPAGAWTPSVRETGTTSPLEPQDAVLSQSAATTVLPAGAWRADVGRQPSPQQTAASAPDAQGTGPYPSYGGVAFQSQGTVPYRPEGAVPYQPQGTGSYPSYGGVAYQSQGTVPYRPEETVAYQPQETGPNQPPSVSEPAPLRSRRTWIVVSLVVLLVLAVAGGGVFAAIFLIS